MGKYMRLSDHFSNVQISLVKNNSTSTFINLAVNTFYAENTFSCNATVKL